MIENRKVDLSDLTDAIIKYTMNNDGQISVIEQGMELYPELCKLLKYHENTKVKFLRLLNKIIRQHASNR